MNFAKGVIVVAAAVLLFGLLKQEFEASREHADRSAPATASVAATGDPLRGRVRDAARGTALAGVTVHVSPESSPGRVVRTARTDDEGRFVLWGLGAGSWRLRPSSPTHLPSEGVAVNVPTPREVTLSLAPGAVVEGRVDGEVDGPTVELVGRDGVAATATPDAAGAFRFEGVASGTYELTLTGAGSTDPLRRKTITLEDGDALEVALRVRS